MKLKSKTRSMIEKAVKMMEKKITKKKRKIKNLLNTS